VPVPVGCNGRGESADSGHGLGPRTAGRLQCRAGFRGFANELIERLPRGRNHRCDQFTRASTSIVLNLDELRSSLPGRPAPRSALGGDPIQGRVPGELRLIRLVRPRLLPGQRRGLRSAHAHAAAVFDVDGVCFSAWTNSSSEPTLSSKRSSLHREGTPSGVLVGVVVYPPHDDGPIGVALDEIDEHLLPEARVKLHAEVGARPRLRDAHPAAVLAGRVHVEIPGKWSACCPPRCRV
jgi:hypothetical protein